MTNADSTTDEGQAARDTLGAPIFCYSTDEEYYSGSFDTREEALAEGRDGDASVTVWTGVQVPVAIKVDAWNVIERLTEDVYEECGDVVEGWLDNASAEERDDLSAHLSAAFMAWAKKHTRHLPYFWSVADIEKHAPAAVEVPA